MMRAWFGLVVGLLVGVAGQVWAVDGPLRVAPNLRVRANENGYLLASAAGAGAIEGPLTNFGNIRLRTDENGYLRVALAGAAVLTGVSTASGPLTLTPAAGSNLNVVLSTTGDFAVNTDQFYVDTSTGRVGVGTAAPGRKFQVVDTGGPIISLVRDDANDFRFELTTDGSVMYIGPTDSGDLRLRAGAAADVLTVQSGGNVGINDLTPDFLLDVVGTVAMPSISGGAAGDEDVCMSVTTGELTQANAATCIVSSLRYKSNWQPLADGLSKVLRLTPGSFYYTNDLTQRAHIGLNAENMHLVEPRLAFYEQAGPDIGKPRGVAYEETVALLVQAIQELEARVRELEGR